MALGPVTSRRWEPWACTLCSLFCASRGGSMTQDEPTTEMRTKEIATKRPIRRVHSCQRVSARAHWGRGKLSNGAAAGREPGAEPERSSFQTGLRSPPGWTDKVGPFQGCSCLFPNLDHIRVETFLQLFVGGESRCFPSSPFPHSVWLRIWGKESP